MSMLVVAEVTITAICRLDEVASAFAKQFLSVCQMQSYLSEIWSTLHHSILFDIEVGWAYQKLFLDCLFTPLDNIFMFQIPQTTISILIKTSL